MSWSQEEQGPASVVARKGAALAWLVVDPASATSRELEQVRAFGERLGDTCGRACVVLTQGPDEAAQAARAAAAAGARKLFVAGGDVAVRGAVNGLCAGDVTARKRPDLGVIPIGAEAEVARTLGVAGASLDALDALDGLLEAEPLDVDLGVVNGRVFLNASAGGLVGDDYESVDPDLKTFAGRFAYALGGVRGFLDHKSFTVRYRSGAGERPLSGRERIMLYAVRNASAAGGGRLASPRAEADGLLEVCFVREASPFALTATLAKLAEGEHVEGPHVMWLRARRLELSFDRPMTVDADGESFEARSASYGVLPRALRLLAPRAARSFEALAKSA
jgi:diacylglycerol kinase (ATP)